MEKAEIKTVEWHGDSVWLIDQTLLPSRLEIVKCRTVAQLAHAIKSMQVRGAPAIGVTAAMGVALAARRAAFEGESAVHAAVDAACRELGVTRPTAVNLFWGLERMRAVADDLRGSGGEAIAAGLADAAENLAAEDEATCRAMGQHGAALISDGDGVLTHCNAGGLAAVTYGTALGVVRAAHEAGCSLHVWVDETRPFLQGARLTAWELQRLGIASTLITDSMAGHFMAQGRIQKIVVGADRIAANGDVANKIGTYGLAVLARAHHIPFYVGAPLSTVDWDLPDGAAIPIEERDPGEVTHLHGTPLAPDGMPAAHPAFDVTPHALISAIVTEAGVLRPPLADSLAEVRTEAYAVRAAS
ncbi:MAG: S-methyl-5-thioribose-1-phosphate isomerase [Dehalococcoidia bacterium]|nr:S-methyl-5-thioribose-1-phosphate isomerase [Dehalococcoidia bacterium]